MDKIRETIYKEESIVSEKIRKEKNDELELKLDEDRARLDKIRMDLYELIAIEESKIQQIKIKNLI